MSKGHPHDGRQAGHHPGGPRAIRSAAPAIRLRTATVRDAALLADLGARTFRQAYAADTDHAELETFIAAH